MILEHLEPIIEVVARRCARSREEIGKLERIGRIRAWKILEQSPEAEVSEVCNSIERSFREQLASENEVVEQIDLSEFDKIRALRGMLKKKYGRCYIHRLQSKSTSVPATVVRALVENVWQLRDEQIPAVNYDKFVSARMTNFLWAFYRNSPMRAIQDAYPDRFFEWQFNRVTEGFWSGQEGYQHAIDAFAWLCKKYGYNGQGNLTIGEKEIRKEGLSFPFGKYFNDSAFLAVQAIFPDIKPWQAQGVSRGFMISPKIRDLPWTLYYQV